MKKCNIEFKKMIVGFYEYGKPVKELSKEMVIVIRNSLLLRN